MKKIFSIFLYSLGIIVPFETIAQGLQVNPPATSTKKTVVIPHAIYPSTFLLSEPQINSIDLNEAGDKVAMLQQSGEVKTLSIVEVQTGKSSEIKINGIEKAKNVYYLNDQLLALEILGEGTTFDIIDIASKKVVTNIKSNQYIGSTASTAYFCNQNRVNSTIEKFELASKKTANAGAISGEVYGWYFTKAKGIVGVAVHSNMISKIYSIENDKLGKSLFEFSSNFYFETKGCNTTGDVFYGITNFQNLTNYACSITQSGIKPLNDKTAESCTDIFIQGNDIALSTNNINSTEYQESKNPTIQKVLNFARESFKGSSIQIFKISEKSNNILFCVQSEISKPRFFVWTNNSAKPISSDKYEAKNLTFISSDVVQIQTGETTPQSGRIFLPTKDDKSSYPMVVYIPNNIFLPYPNQFNPIVQHLCQNGYAVFVWNTRYSFRPKIGFAYSDLVASFSEDVNLVLKFLKSQYSILPENSFIFGEGLGGYLALNASASDSESFNGVIVNRINFPGKEYGQDLLAARMFGEDAQAKWSTLDRISLSPKTFYLSYSSDKSKTEVALENLMKANNIKWTAHSADNVNKSASSKDLDGIITWLQHLSQIETRVFEVKPNVELKKK
jgi:hypothetical protein